jgi:CubicO group peptidase (beta-lactamase class C family)
MKRAVRDLRAPFTLFLLLSVPCGASDVALEAKVDQIFAEWNKSSSPGCAVAASVDGKQTLAKAYGMADLEHDIPNTPETIFEAGSVAKQFTAAAVLLLAQDGKLSLEDPVRKYVPELPDYTSAITIRQILTHTSGLRDWSDIVAIAGWPRGSRVYTMPHVLDILARQHSLNFEPGTRWSYSNSGYNLAAIIVERVSGTSFADFTKARIFEPLGMTHTSWRDDYTRVVKKRAIAYSRTPDGFHSLMPFENIYGSGGLLTTVGDLLKWNENFVTHKVGGADFASQQLEPGRLRNGRAHNYAMGLFIESHKGQRVVQHAGATAGYAAGLMRFPEQRLSVAVLCNIAIRYALAPGYAFSVADFYLPTQDKPSAKAEHTLTRKEIDAVQGLFRNVETDTALQVIEENGKLRILNGPRLVATSGTTFTYGESTLKVMSPGNVQVTDQFGIEDRYTRVEPVTPTPENLAQFAGTYVSDEAETSLTVVADGTKLLIKRRPDATFTLEPIYTDVFGAGPRLGTFIFRRNSSGRPIAFSIVQDRLSDLRFERNPTDVQ